MFCLHVPYHLQSHLKRPWKTKLNPIFCLYVNDVIRGETKFNFYSNSRESVRGRDLEKAGSDKTLVISEAWDRR